MRCVVFSHVLVLPIADTSTFFINPRNDNLWRGQRASASHCLLQVKMHCQGVNPWLLWRQKIISVKLSPPEGCSANHTPGQSNFGAVRAFEPRGEMCVRSLAGIVQVWCCRVRESQNSSDRKRDFRLSSPAANSALPPWSPSPQVPHPPPGWSLHHCPRLVYQ